MVNRVLLLLWISFVLVGCQAAQLGFEQSNMRGTLLRLYENQVLDNLVRAKLGYPIVQVDYSNMTGTLGQEASLSVGQDETRSSTRNILATGTMGTLFTKVRTFLLEYGGSAKQTAALAITGQAVISTDSVYQAYVDAANDPDIIKRKDNKPLKKGDASKKDPCEPADTYNCYHLIHEFQGETWYVPFDKKAAFFRLYLATTVQRQTKGPLILTIDTEIIRTVKVTKIEDKDKDNVWTLEIKLRDKIPNDRGKLTVAINGIEKSFRYRPVQDVPEGQPKVPQGQPTDRVELINAETESKLTGDALAKAIEGKTATLRNDTFVPGFVSPLPDKLEEIRSQQELQRLQQLLR